MSYQGYQQLLVERQGKIVVVKFNNPQKKNCLNTTAYEELGRVLREVNDDDNATIILFTGVGDYFTAGNDLSVNIGTEDMSNFALKNNKIFKGMVMAFINCTKIMFSLVNGPAIGIGATIVGLCDVAWCVDKAYFLTPFSKLGLVPEGCSSYLMPQIVGRSKATELLLLNEPLSAQEAYHFSFVSRIYKESDLNTVIWPKIQAYSELPRTALLDSKRLLRMPERENLLRANDEEAKTLLLRFENDEFIQAIMDFATRKNKSKL